MAPNAKNLRKILAVHGGSKNQRQPCPMQQIKLFIDPNSKIRDSEAAI
jgi:hypothetical protein